MRAGGDFCGKGAQFWTGYCMLFLYYGMQFVLFLFTFFILGLYDVCPKKKWRAGRGSV